MSGAANSAGDHEFNHRSSRAVAWSPSIGACEGREKDAVGLPWTKTWADGK